MSAVVERYLKHHPSRHDIVFYRPLRKALQRYIAVNGDQRVEDVTPLHARRFVRHRLSEGVKTSTVRRDLHQLAAATSFYLEETRVRCVNPFHRVPIPMEGHDKKRRQPMTHHDLCRLKYDCVQTDDDIRWLAGVLSDSGARLSEIAGMALDDIQLGGATPHIRITPHPWRRLKSTSSVREIPLIGVALWAAQRVVEHARPGQIHAFPRYNRQPRTKGTHASSTIGLWIKRCGVTTELHGFRHTMVDRLRRVGCPAEIRAAICGWTIKNIEVRYGAGYGIEELRAWMLKIENADHLSERYAPPQREPGQQLTGNECAAKMRAFIQEHGPATRGRMLSAGALTNGELARGLRYSRDHGLLARADLVSSVQHTRYRLTGKPMVKPGAPLPGVAESERSESN
ncbi:tyrosine-type recombinase/integrase [Cupriavidus sp. H19C3]|uniref:tyrosine-type recombinase/integrase n=1 Tax=Cupriavidus sp. H19C3 TaxID=3241603 RepID=UPI003BF7A71C